MDKSAIFCRDLGKSFGKPPVPALKNISFEVAPGQIIGLLGPDGAGKTTLMRLFAKLFNPTSGSLGVQGSVGYMPQKFGLYENLSVAENLRLYAELHAVPVELQPERFEQLLAMTDLDRFRPRMAGDLSGGMKQKLALACALVARPDVLLLDEPTVGVDVLSRRELWKILRLLADREHLTVFASTAYLDEAAYCDRVLVLYQGRLIRDDAPAELLRLASPFEPKPTFETGFQVLLTGAPLPPLTRRNPAAADAPVVVKADNLVKKFGTFTAVDRLSFEVRRGEIFGLLGANGAGKTTTFRMLCGLSAANTGSVEIDGISLRDSAEAARAKIGFVAQKFSLYGDLSVRENLAFFGGAYGLFGKRKRDRIEWALDSFALRPAADTLASRLPLGFKQRLGVSCALLHEPEILFLDEATSGADPMARHEFWARIMALADDGVAVIITTHFLDEAVYCDRMVIMQNGLSAASGSADDIRRAGEHEVLEEAFVNIIRRFRKEHGMS